MQHKLLVISTDILTHLLLNSLLFTNVLNPGEETAENLKLLERYTLTGKIKCYILRNWSSHIMRHCHVPQINLKASYVYKIIPFKVDFPGRNPLALQRMPL